MRKTLLLAVAFVSCLSWAGSTAPRQAQTNPSYDRASSSIDGYDYKGFTTSLRPVKLISSDEKNGIFVINSLRGDPRPDAEKYFYWSEAKINEKLLYEAYWGWFPAVWGAGIPMSAKDVGHSVLVFAFKKDGLITKSGEDVPGFVVSVETRLKTNEPYDPVLGQRRHYPIIWGVYSLNGFVAEWVGDTDSKLNLFPLQISAEQKYKLLKIAIRDSVKDRTGEYYNTLGNSCTNNPMRLLGETLGRQFLVGEIAPDVAVKHLQMHGYIGKNPTILVNKTNWRTVKIRPLNNRSK